MSSFAQQLYRLRLAADTREKGIRPDKTFVYRRDLADLLYHFDRIDKEIRELIPANKVLTEHVAELTAKWDTAQRMLGLANKALENAGSAARFGLKINIPEGSLVFADTAETLEQNWDDEPAYSQKQWNELTTRAEQAEGREKALQNVYREAALICRDIAMGKPIVTMMLNNAVCNYQKALAGHGESNGFPTVTKYQNFKAKDGQRVKCGYCGEVFISVGDTDEYKHNLVKCKAKNEP